MATLKERLKAVLGLDTREFERGLSKSGKQVKAFGDTGKRSLAGMWSEMTGIGKAFLGGLGIGVVSIGLEGLISGARGAIKSLASVGDEAKRAGMSVEAFQEWKYVAEQNRIGIDAVVDGFKELNLRADEFITTGNGSAADAFKRLGFRAEDLQKKLKDPSALMLEIIGRLEGLDTAAQIRIADEIFGGTAGEQFVQLLGQGEQGIRDTISAAREAGAVIDDQLIRKAEELDRRWTALTTTTGNWFKGIAVGTVDAITSLGSLQHSLDTLLGDEARARAILGNEVYDALAAAKSLTEEQVQMVAELDGQTRLLISMAKTMAEEFAAVSKELAAENPQLARNLAAAAAQMEALTFQLEAGLIAADEFTDKLGGVIDDARASAAELAEIDAVGFGTILKGLDDLAAKLVMVAQKAMAARSAIPGNANQTTGTPLSGDVDTLMPPSVSAPTSSKRVVLPNVDSYGNWLEAGKTKGGGGGGGGSASALDRQLQSIKDQTAALEAESLALIALAESGQNYAGVLDYARKKAELMTAAQKDGKAITPELAAEIDALAKSYATAATSAEEAQERLDAIALAGERGGDAIADLFGGVLTGAKSAKQALAGLLQEMAMVQLRKSVLGLGGGGGFFGFVGSLLGNANGTTNWRGGISLVGERGAELVSMPRGSQVFSATATQKMLEGDGGGGTRVEVVPSEYFDVRVTSIADQSAAKMGAQINQGLPARVQQINANPRKR